MTFYILGQLEITFLISFCRAGKLSALLQDDTKLPEKLKPYISRLQALYESPPAKPKEIFTSQLEALNENVLSLLVERLNNQRQENCTWVTPKVWTSFSSDDALGYAPVPPRAFFQKRIHHHDVTYSTFETNPNDTFVSFKSFSDKSESFGRISKIFGHRRSPFVGENINDTWFLIHVFRPLKSSQRNPFAAIKIPDIQTHLRLWAAPEDRIVRLDEIVAHCSWLMYKPKELDEDVNVGTVALVSMLR